MASLKNNIGNLYIFMVTNIKQKIDASKNDL